MSGADIACGLVAADVLFARLQGKTESRIARRILGETDEAPGKAALVVVLRREESGMRAAVAQRHAEALRAADHDIRPEFPGRFDQSEGEKIGRHDKGSADGVDAGGQVAVVVDPAIRGGILHEGAEVGGIERGLGPRAGDDAQAEGFGPRAEQGDGLRMNIVRDEKFIPRTFDPVRHGHGLGSRGGLIEQGGIGNFHAGEVGHHGLEIEQGLEAALRQFRLVRRVGGIPTGIFEDVAQDDRRRVATVVAQAEVTRQGLVLVGEGADFGESRGLVERGRQVERFAAADHFRHGRVDQRVEARITDGLEHVRDFLMVGTNVTTDKVGLRCGGHAHKKRVSRFARGSRRGISARRAAMDW